MNNPQAFPGETTKAYKVLTNIIKAWDFLDGDRNYTPNTIENWLINKMKPAINKARKLLKKP
ncbi:MAG: hypothetical protein M0R03_20320 [Novosphingobium sp.]|nr:hypothetical protein [Novosphingobium sp.]